MKVSVVMATHNGAQFIQEQIESILFQSNPVSEIIVSDDASSDGTLGIITKTLRKHHNTVAIPKLVTLPNSKPLGIAKNFAQGLKAASFPIIALADQDDVWHKDKIKKLLNIFEQQPEVLLVHSNAELTNNVGLSLGLSLFEALGISPSELDLESSDVGYKALLRRNLVTGATVLVRKKLVDQALPVPSAWIHDEWLAMIASILGRVESSTEKLISYRQHGKNQIGAQKITASARISRLTTNRTERNARLYRRSEELITKLKELGDIVPSEALLAAEAKLAHEEFRSNLSRWRALRFFPVIVHAFSRNYQHYGRGAQDILRDLLQPGNDK